MCQLTGYVFFFVKLAVNVEPAASVALTAGATVVVHAYAKDATIVTALVPRKSADARRSPNAASAPNVVSYMNR